MTFRKRIRIDDLPKDHANELSVDEQVRIAGGAFKLTSGDTSRSRDDEGPLEGVTIYLDLNNNGQL